MNVLAFSKIYEESNNDQLYLAFTYVVLVLLCCDSYIGCIRVFLSSSREEQLKPTSFWRFNQLNY